jgi:hypothetical protein
MKSKTSFLTRALPFVALIVVAFVQPAIILRCSAQTLVTPSPKNDQGSEFPYPWVPRPYAFGGLALGGAGYSAAATGLGSGLTIENSHFIGLAEASYDNSRKQDSGTGHDVYLKSRVFFRAPKQLYFGGGAQWNKLVTATYSKQAWRPVFGGGKDFVRSDFSLRAQVVYVLPGTDHLNAVQGAEISIWIPSPATKHHFFFRMVSGIYEYHQTAVPGNPGTEKRGMTGPMQLGLMWRF